MGSIFEKISEFLRSPQKIRLTKRGILDLSDEPIDLPPPTVLINIADDDTTRGDTAGRRGLGRTIAKKLGTKSLYADVKTLSETYPDMEDKTYDKKLERFLDENGVPDIVVGFDCTDVLQRLGKPVEDIQTYSSFNESLASNLLNEDQLVAHHLTAEMMEEAGAEFDAEHPAIKKPIIAILIAQQGSDGIYTFADKLTNIAAHYPEATIYICGGRRNNLERQQETEEKLNALIDEKGLGKTMDVISWEFSREGYNPYKGLIARADHFILWGNSQSLMSEPLFAGKTVHLYDSHTARGKLKRQGCLAEFNECAADKPFMTKHFEPINLTDRLADKMIADTTTQRESNARDFRHRLREQSTPKAWQSHLVQIRFRPETVTEIPDKLLRNKNFVQQMLRINGMVLRHTEIKALENTKMAITLMKERPQYFQNLPEKARDNKDVVLACARSKPAHFVPYMSPRLRQSRPFCEQLLKRSYDAMAFMQEDIQSDRKLVTKLLKEDPDHAFIILSHCADSLRDDEDFMRSMLAITPRAYHGLSARLKNQEEFALVLLKSDPRNFSLMPDDIRANRKCALTALAGFDDAMHFVDLALSSDVNFIVEAIAAKGEAVYLAGHVWDNFKNDLSHMKTIVAQSTAYFGEAGRDLLNNIDYAQFGLEMGVEDLLKKCGPEVRRNPYFVLEAVADNPAHLADIDRSLYEDEDFVRALMEFVPPAKIYNRCDLAVRNIADISHRAVDEDISMLANVGAGLMRDPEFIAAIVEKHHEALFGDEDPFENTHNGALVWQYIAAFGDVDYQKIPETYRNDKYFGDFIIEINPQMKTAIEDYSNRKAQADSESEPPEDSPLSKEHIKEAFEQKTDPPKLSFAKAFMKAAARPFQSADTTSSPTIPVDKNTFH